MEFEDMQVLWNEQNNERLFAINEEALHAQIKSKGKSVNNTLSKVEGMMIWVNLIVSIVLVFDTIWESGPVYELIVPAMYFGYSIIAIFLRSRRRQDEVQFEPTMLGDLDKALWQVNYLIKQSQQMVLWYLAPVMIVVIGLMLLDGKFLFALGLTAVVIPVTIYGGRWEVERCYMPKKRELEALRAKLTEPILE